MKQNKDITYCICTEGSDLVFPYLRVMLLSLFKHNSWVKGEVVILTCDITPLSTHNRKILESIVPNIKYVDIDSKQYNSLNVRNSNRGELLTNLYRINAFSLHGFDFVMYISSLSFCISSITKLFVGNSDTLAANSGTTAISREPGISARNITEFNSSVMIISKEVLDAKLKGAMLARLKNTRCIASSDISNAIRDVIRLNGNNISYQSVYSIVKKSKYNDSKFSKFKAIQPKVAFIELDIGINEKKKTAASFMYKEMNRLWNSYNIQGEWNSEETPSGIVNMKAYVERVKKRKVVHLPKVSNSLGNDRYKLNAKFLKNSDIEFKNLIESGATDSAISNHYDTAVVIAFKDRHNIVKLNIECLAKQSLVPAVVLVTSSISDYVFALNLKSSNPNVFIALHQNYPIGGKWAAGVEYARRLNVKGLMILGSDDLLSLDYFKTCFDAIDHGKGSSGTGADLIGNREWYIYDTSETLYHLRYTDNVTIMLGGGKMFSKYFLDSLDWNIFVKNRPKHLDEYGYSLVKSFSNKFKIINTDNFILSIKGSWEVINPIHDILKAKHRVSYRNVSSSIVKLSESLKITDISKYLK